MSYDDFKQYAEKHGKMIIIIFNLIDLKREIKYGVVFLMRAKTLSLNVILN